MSLYNMLFGVNPLAGILLAMLAIDYKTVPRFRDCFLYEHDDGKRTIAIHTRTGGGNREDYWEENEAMAQHPLYMYDEDDDFDCTYATFYYRLPEAYLEDLGQIFDAVETFSPSERWKALLMALETKAQESKDGE